MKIPSVALICCFSCTHALLEVGMFIFINNNCLTFCFIFAGEDFDYQVRMEFIKVKKELGEGGFGTVYLALDELFN